MAWKGVITNAGQQMLNQYIAGGHVLHIDGAKVGSGTTAESSMRAATALNSQKDTAAVMNKVASGDSTKIRVQVGPHATTAYTAKEIGVWAHIDSNASQLMCLNQDTEGGVAIPTKGQSQDFAFTLNVVVAVSNTDSLVVEDDPDAYVSLGTMQAAIAAATPDASSSAKGLMSSADKTKLDGIAAGANNYTHPSYTARTGKPTANAAPAFGGTVTVSQVTSDSQGHVTGMTDRTITIPGNEATTSAKGLMSAADKTKLNGLTSSAASQSAAGYMSAADKTKLDGIAAGANAYTHPAFTQRNTGFYKVHVNTQGHVDSVTNVAASDITGLVPAAGREATTSANGLMSAADKSDLNDLVSDAMREKPRPTQTSLDSIKTPGIYYVSRGIVADGWPGDIATASAANTYSLLEVMHCYGQSSTTYGYVQRLYVGLNKLAPSMYYRTKFANNEWSSWMKVDATNADITPE